jgi:hypothetical protein
VLWIGSLAPVRPAQPARPVLALGVAAAAAVVAAGAGGMHHGPFGKNDRRDRGGAVPWLPGPTGGQA